MQADGCVDEEALGAADAEVGVEEDDVFVRGGLGWRMLGLFGTSFHLRVSWLDSVAISRVA